jgi:hypothetical protein
MIPVSKKPLINGNPVFIRLCPICFDAAAMSAKQAPNTTTSIDNPIIEFRANGDLQLKT